MEWNIPGSHLHHETPGPHMHYPMVFYIYKPMTIQLDATQKNLGNILFQDGHPVIFSFKAVTPLEQCYANIEYEMLACVFGENWINAYVSGHAFTIGSNHNPPEQFKLKDLTDAQVCLKRNTVPPAELWYYHQVLPWLGHVGSRCPLPLYTIWCSKITLDIAIYLVHFTPQKKTEFQAATYNNQSFSVLQTQSSLGCQGT